MMTRSNPDVLAELRCTDGVMGSPSVRYYLDLAVQEIERLGSVVCRENRRERAIHAAVTEMSLFTGNLEMKVRKAIERYEFVLRIDEP
jgi:hypothetical protein